MHLKPPPLLRGSLVFVFAILLFASGVIELHAKELRKGKDTGNFTLKKIKGRDWPIPICDFAIRFKDGEKDILSWKPATDSVAAGKAYADYVKAALQTNYVLGVFWCNPVDTPKGFGKSGVKQGFFGEGMARRPGLHQSVKEVNSYRVSLTPKK